MASAPEALSQRLDRLIPSSWLLSFVAPVPWLTRYQVGANKSKIVTKVSSLGMWFSVYDGEWDGDVPLGLDRPSGSSEDPESGVVTFRGDTLPWLAGKYEASC